MGWPDGYVSNPVLSQNLLTFSPWYGGTGLAKNWGFAAVLIGKGANRKTAQRS